jgi:hypothetical protein
MAESKEQELHTVLTVGDAGDSNKATEVKPCPYSVLPDTLNELNEVRACIIR